MLDKYGKLFKATTINVTEMIIPSIGNVKQIGSTYYNYFILNDKNQLYFKGEYNTTSDDRFIDLKGYNNIKLYSGLSTKLYFTYCCNNGKGSEKVCSILEDTTEVKELVFKGEQESYFFPIAGYEFAYIINTNNPNWFEEDRESKEVERMVHLLLKQQQQQQNGEQFNNSFRDITFQL